MKLLGNYVHVISKQPLHLNFISDLDMESIPNGWLIAEMQPTFYLGN